MGVGVDEPGVGHVLADVDDGHSVTGECEHFVPGADRGHRPVFDEDSFRDARLVHRHDPADEDHRVRFGGSCRCRLGARRADWSLGR